MVEARRNTLELSLSDGMLSPTILTSQSMTDEIDKTTGRGAGSRQDRLKSALRENLKRRKLQARERSKTAAPSHDDEATPHEGTAGKVGG